MVDVAEHQLLVEAEDIAGKGIEHGSQLRFAALQGLGLACFGMAQGDAFLDIEKGAARDHASHAQEQETHGAHGPGDFAAFDQQARHQRQQRQAVVEQGRGQVEGRDGQAGGSHAGNHKRDKGLVRQVTGGKQQPARQPPGHAMRHRVQVQALQQEGCLRGILPPPPMPEMRQDARAMDQHQDDEPDTDLPMRHRTPLHCREQHAGDQAAADLIGQVGRMHPNLLGPQHHGLCLDVLPTVWIVHMD